MARNNIQFKGIRHSPSDITGQDGDLLECVNLIHENGELKPIEMPERTGMRFGNGHVLAAIHNVTGGMIFVGVLSEGGDTEITAFRESGASTETVTISGDSSKTIEGEAFQWADTIGNTLIVGTDKSTHYALFKNGEYKWLGDRLPEPIFKFDFRRSAVTDGGYYINEHEPNTYGLDYGGAMVTGGGVPFTDLVSQGAEETTTRLVNDSEENKKIVRDGILSRVATAVQKAKNANVFVYPFFVRYAVRMYDGSYGMHSAPILMIPSSLKCPLLSFFQADMKYDTQNQLWYTELRSDSSSGRTFIRCFDGVWFRGMELKMMFDGFVDGDASDWSDIVKGVDIFLSSQISTFDERQWDNLDNFSRYFYCFEHEIDDGEGTLVPDPEVKDYGHMYSNNKKMSWWDVHRLNSAEQFDYDRLIAIKDGGVFSGADYYGYYRIPLPTRNERSVIEEISNTHLFYKVKEYNLQELSGSWSGYRAFRDEVAEQGVLEKLETLPTLPDDYVSRSKMVGMANFNYNQRLLLGNMQLQAPLWYQDAKTFQSDNYNAKLWFRIDKPEKTIWVKREVSGLGKFDFGHYIYYPDVDCKEAVLVVGSETWRRIEMQEHSGLNGAFALMPLLDSLYEVRASLPTPSISSEPSSEDSYYSLPNTIAMSSVANPFHFEANNFKDIGRAKVIGMAANMLDVSSGQWGQYPLYVFCSDGIMAVMIDGKGEFGGIRAVSADVLREPQGYSQPTLAQTGQALVFLTKRGVMMIAGTRINCVSEAMNGKHFNPLTELSPANSVLYGVGAFSSLITETSDNTDFKTFAATGFLSYDYAHNRVLLMNVGKDYQYVFDLRTGLWSKQVSYTNLANIQVEQVERSLPTLTVVQMKAAVNNYTEMYLQDTDGYLYKTMEVANENVQNSLYQYGYFISRPVRFGTDEYKTITRMLNRYTHYAANSFAKVALYGSRDGVRYGRVNTLRGMGYQYYIFAVYSYLKPNERYSYLSVDFDTRLTNKLR